MKVICIANNIQKLQDQEAQNRLKDYIRTSSGEIDLVIGKEYVVYGVEHWGDIPWYYLCSEEYDDYPKPFAADFFTVVDGSLSRHWQFKYNSASGKKNSVSSLLFKSWSEDETFYERVVDGDEEAISLFTNYRALMDSEQSS